jgi:hypothetical protein
MVGLSRDGRRHVTRPDQLTRWCVGVSHMKKAKDAVMSGAILEQSAEDHQGTVYIHTLQPKKKTWLGEAQSAEYLLGYQDCPRKELQAECLVPIDVDK